MKNFSIKQALWYGIQTTTHHLPFLLGASIITISILTILGISIGLATTLGIPMGLISAYLFTSPLACELISEITSSGQNVSVCYSTILDFFSTRWLLFAFVFLVIFLITYYLSICWLNSLLYLHDHKKSSYKAFFAHPRLLPTFTISSFLYIIVVSLGMITLIVPGIIVAIMFIMFGYVIVDKKAGIIESFYKSERITHGAKWRLFLMGIIMIGIAIPIQLFINRIVPMFSKTPILFFALLAIGALLHLLFSFVTINANTYIYRILDTQTNNAVNQK